MKTSVVSDKIVKKINEIDVNELNLDELKKITDIIVTLETMYRYDNIDYSLCCNFGNALDKEVKEN